LGIYSICAFFLLPFSILLIDPILNDFGVMMKLQLSIGVFRQASKVNSYGIFMYSYGIFMYSSGEYCSEYIRWVLMWICCLHYFRYFVKFLDWIIIIQSRYHNYFSYAYRIHIGTNNIYYNMLGTQYVYDISK